MRTFLFLLLFSLSFIGCKNNTSTKTGSTDSPTKTETPKKYKLSPFTPSPSFSDAKIEAMSYTDGKFDFDISGESYKLGMQTPDAPQKMCANSAKGQHIHLIIDNKPYAAKYTAEFDHDVPDGEHYLLAFLSRSYHESIKSPNAYLAQKITVENKGIKSADIITEPMLFYSRPKGSYVGKANTDKVMLDFYLVNVDLGNGYKVKVNINGEEHIVDKWQPYYIEGLEMGDNNIKLTLIDKDGKMVKTALNPVNRTFKLAADPIEAK